MCDIDCAIKLISIYLNINIIKLIPMLRERIDVELSVNCGGGSDDNNDDHMILTPTSSKTSKTSYIQKKNKKEEPSSQLAELR